MNLNYLLRNRLETREKGTFSPHNNWHLPQSSRVDSYSCWPFIFISIEQSTTRENNVSIPQHAKDITSATLNLTPLRNVDLDMYTIRINTWQRHEQLVVSIEHHAKCEGVAQIQVVWCEDTEPPLELLRTPQGCGRTT